MPYFREHIERNIKIAFERLSQKMYTHLADLEVTAYLTDEPVPYNERETGKKLVLKENDHWGKQWECAWFHLTGIVPESAAGLSTALFIDTGGECLVYDNGIPQRGLTYVENNFDNHPGYPGKCLYRLKPKANGGEKIDLWMDVGCNALLGSSNHNVAKGQVVNCVMRHAKIIEVNENIRSLYYDFQVLIDLMNCLDDKSARRSSILFRLHEAAKVLVNFTPKETEKAAGIVAVELKKKGGDPSFRLNAIGHSHIDLAWLWPIRETRRKGGRTFATALKNMDLYPDYIFGASQPQLYDWIKNDYPAIYEGIKKKVAQKRWELQGAMWCEPDTNIPGGESLVRQLLYGKAFFREEFGKDVRNLWLPDVFGYSAALPQILKLAGVDYFMTTKLAFNVFNRFPYHTFYWQGIDGTKILSHMLPEGTYNGAMTPSSIKKAENNHAENGLIDEALMLYGIGDGGGGPGMEHLERAARMENIEGLVPVSHGLAEDFLVRLEKNVNRLENQGSNISTHRGELYFDRHQGTYTTQCKTKWYNRKIEFLFKELEMLLVTAGTNPYPKQELDALWKEFLLYQFHDILPGSSINAVYEVTNPRSEIIYNRLQEMIRETCAAFAGDEVVVNALSWDRWEWTEINGKTERVFAKALSVAPPQILDRNEVSVSVNQNNNEMENEFLCVRFDEDGSLVSVFDKTAQKESLRCGTKGNRLSVWDDQGDCWDIPIEYLYLEPEYFILVKQTLVHEGYRSVMRQEYKFGSSEIKMDVCLYSGKPWLDFQTTVDWQEDRKMLRTGFDTDIITDAATFEIQFGSLKRTVSENNTYETAQFETCGHKWADLSQTGRGVALLNDCKYGYRIKGSLLELCLLRAQNWPGIGSDRGKQEFKYALYPHKGSLETVVREAFAYNLPLRTEKANGTKAAVQIFNMDTNSVVLDTVKHAENGKETITRFYESIGADASVNVKPDAAYTKAVLCDLLENEISDLLFTNNEIIKLTFAPFQIQTVKWS